MKTNRTDTLLAAISDIDTTILTAIEETCVSFDPALCPETILLLNGQKISHGQPNTERCVTYFLPTQTLDEHELALAEG